MAKLAQKLTWTDMTYTQPDTEMGDPNWILFTLQKLSFYPKPWLIGDCLLFGVKENERKTDRAIDA